MSVVSALIPGGEMLMNLDLVKQRIIKTRGPPTRHVPSRGSYVRVNYDSTKPNVPLQFNNQIALVSSTLDDGYCNVVTADANGSAGEIDLHATDRIEVNANEVPDEVKMHLQLIDEEFFRQCIDLALTQKFTNSLASAEYRCGTIVVRVRDVASSPLVGVVMYSDRSNCVTVAWLGAIVWYRRHLVQCLRRATQFDMPQLGSRACDRLVRCYSLITGAMLRHGGARQVMRQYDSFIAPFQFVELQADGTIATTNGDSQPNDLQYIHPPRFDGPIED